MRWLLTFLIALPASAAPTWSVLPFEARGVEPGAVETFHDLLVTELGARNGARFVASDQSCSDVPCARKVGQQLGSDVVVYGKVASLGRNLVVTASAVDVGQNTTLSQQRMSVDQVEDLEAVAARMASAMVTGEQVEQTAELGALTHREVRPDLRREGHRGPSVRVGGAGLVGRSDLGGAGITLSLGYWYEARAFAIEPFVAGRFGADEPGSAFGLGFNVGAYYIPGQGDVTPFVGGGGGVRYVGGTQHVTASAGQVVMLSTETEKRDAVWGPGAFGRLGVLFFRTYSMRMSVSVDYDITLADVFGENVQLVQGGVAIMF